MYELYLAHHGVNGQKWGIRRYQNKDGSLTPKGKKKYDKMSDDKLRKVLYKQVKDERARQTNWSNKWMVNNTIGTNSKKVQDKYIADRKKYMDSDEYKKALKKVKKLDRDVDDGKIDYDQYEDEYEKIRKSAHKPEFDTSVKVTNAGREYSQKYLDTYGRDLNIGYLRDLGYDRKTAEEFVDRILKANKKLLNGM